MDAQLEWVIDECFLRGVNFGGGSGQPSKVNGGVGGEVMSMRVRLRREKISRLVASKKLLLCF